MRPRLTDSNPDFDLAGMEADYRAGLMSQMTISKKYGIAQRTVGNYAERYGWKRDLAPAIREKTAAEMAKEDAIAERKAAIEAARIEKRRQASLKAKQARKAAKRALKKQKEVVVVSSRDVQETQDIAEPELEDVQDVVVLEEQEGQEQQEAKKPKKKKGGPRFTPVEYEQITEDEIVDINAKLHLDIVKTHRGAIKTLRVRNEKIEDQIVKNWQSFVDQEKPKDRLFALKLISEITKNASFVLSKLIPLERQAFNMDGKTDTPNDDDLNVFKVRDRVISQLEAFVRVTQVRPADDGDQEEPEENREYH